ncbi:MAG TPA: PQQ-binding-like beta-propeller repeat protein [Ktedonobacterales bacterium]
MRASHWLAGRALIVAVALAPLASLLAGCAPGSLSSPRPAGGRLPAVIITSATEATASSAGFETLHIAALDPANGIARWTYETTISPLRAHRAPVVAGGIIYVSSDALPATASATLPVGSLTALSERDGHTVWTAHPGALSSEPVVSGGVVYASGIAFASAGQVVTSFFALRADTGQQIWRADLHAENRAGAPPDQGFGVEDTLVVANGAVYDASNPSCFDTCGAAWLLALRASDGKRLWKKRVTDAGTIGRPVVTSGALYTVVTSVSETQPNPFRQVAAYSASDGAERWNVPMPAIGPLIAANGLLYATSIAQEQPPGSPILTFTLRIVALDPATGVTRWRVTTSTGDTDSYLPLAAMTPDILYVQSITNDGYSLAGLDPSTGAVRWRTPLALLVGSMLMDGATLYAMTSFIQRGGATERNASLLAFSASDGHAQWSAPLPAGSTSGEAPLARAGGVVVAAYLSATLSAYETYGDHHLAWRVTTPGWLLGLVGVD